MSKNYSNLRQLWDTRYTPVTPEVQELMHLARAEAGGTWRSLAAITGLKTRQLRRIYKAEHKAVAFRTMDQIFCRSNHLHRLLDLEWLTIDELLERGIWRPQFALELEQVLQPQGIGRTDDWGYRIKRDASDVPNIDQPVLKQEPEV